MIVLLQGTVLHKKLFKNLEQMEEFDRDYMETNKMAIKFECKGIKVDEKEFKEKVTQKNLAQRVSAIELEFATHNATCSERYKNQKETLDRIEKTIKKNSEAIDKLFGISNKGLGAIKVLIMVGSIVVGFFSYFKFKDFI